MKKLLLHDNIVHNFNKDLKKKYIIETILVFVWIIYFLDISILKNNNFYIVGLLSIDYFQYFMKF